jgi:hypothetical protein
MTTPSLALDFTTAALDSRVAFSRVGATATRVNSSGYIETVAANTARFDFDPITLVCRGLLIEGTRTNVIFDSVFQAVSTTIGNNQWFETAAELDTTVNAATAPDNTNTAALLSINATAVARAISYRTAINTSNTYTVSVFAKPNSTDDKVSLLLGGETNVTNRCRVVFTLSGNGAVGTVVAAGTAVSGGASITKFGNGWYRCTLSVTLTSPSNVTVFLYPGDFSAQTTATQTLVWGAQLEVGAFATSYIPTGATEVTRNADVATITGTNFSDFWQASKGGAQVQALPSTVSGIRPLVQYDDGTADNIIALRGNAANPELQIVDGGAPQVQLDAGTIVANTPYSLTGWWQTNDCKARQNSGATVSDYTATIPTVTQARLGSDGTNYLNGHLATVNYYDSFFGQSIYTRRKNKVIFNLL